MHRQSWNGWAGWVGDDESDKADLIAKANSLLSQITATLGQPTGDPWITSHLQELKGKAAVLVMNAGMLGTVGNYGALQVEYASIASDYAVTKSKIGLAAPPAAPKPSPGPVYSPPPPAAPPPALPPPPMAPVTSKKNVLALGALGAAVALVIAAVVSVKK